MASNKFEKEVEKAAEILSQGGIILYPTDTIWGIGCDAENPEAVKKIYTLKKRSDSKAMLILVDSVETLKSHVKNLPSKALEEIESSNSPLTVIYDSPLHIAQNLLAEDGSIGIRITNEFFSNQLCKKFGRPIVSTSANISGCNPPSNFSRISDEILSNVDYVVDYRRDEENSKSPSRIIKVNNNNEITVIR